MRILRTSKHQTALVDCPKTPAFSNRERMSNRESGTRLYFSYKPLLQRSIQWQDGKQSVRMAYL